MLKKNPKQESIHLLPVQRDDNKMQLFFNRLAVVANALPRHPSWNYCESGLKRNLRHVIQYYQTRAFTVKNNHLLIKLLLSLNVDYNQNLERYYNAVNDKTNKLAQTFKMTSPVYSGMIHEGVFYGPGTKEILLADDTYISPYEIEKDWKNYSSVTVLDHPRSDLDLLIPNGKETSIEKGLACICINISALAVQFRAFAKEQMYREEQGEQPFSIAFFLYRYVLPNMLYSHLDVALFNRIYNLSVGKPMGESLVKHPFYIVPFTQRVDNVYKDYLERLKGRRIDFYSMLRSIPISGEKTLLELMRLPELAPTRQLSWAETITRLKCIEFLITNSEKGGRLASGKDVNHFTNRIQRLINDNGLRQIRDDETLQSVMRQIKDIYITTETPYSFH